MSGNISIRLMRTVDVESCIALWSEMPEISLRADSDSQELLSAFVERNPTTCLVATDDAHVVGTVMGGYDGRRGYIYHLAVHEEYRGCGLGRDLLERVTTALEQAGAGRVHLFVLNDNADGMDFYRHIGWTERPEVTLFTMLKHG